MCRKMHGHVCWGGGGNVAHVNPCHEGPAGDEIVVRDGDHDFGWPTLFWQGMFPQNPLQLAAGFLAHHGGQDCHVRRG